MESKLQIISGQNRGRKLLLPPNARPTQNRARIALFNMIMPMIDWNTPRIVWDAFAGSGAFALEILSRVQNATAVFTDISPTSIAVVRKNIDATNAATRTRVIQTDAMVAIRDIALNADLIFVDPPYADASVGVAFVRRVGAIMRVGTILIWEQDAEQSVLPDMAIWNILRDKKYGRARFLILQKK